VLDGEPPAMSVIGEFTVPSDSFLLGESLQAVPEMAVELQRVVTHSHDRIVPFFWAHRGDDEAFDAAVREDPTLADVVRLDDYDEGVSYRGTWTGKAEGVAYAYIDARATILEATGQDDSWTLRMRLDDDRTLSQFHRHCQSEGIPFTLHQLYHPDQPMGGGQYGITPTQWEMLVTAYRLGARREHARRDGRGDAHDRGPHLQAR
jgi:predicted DNA binding protein